MSTEKTMEYIRGFEDGSADREGKIAQLQADVERLNKRMAELYKWASASKMVATQMVSALERGE